MDEDRETEFCPEYHDNQGGENKPFDITKGRLYIKLKLPTAANPSNGEETGMHGDEQLETLRIRKDYVCDFCNKRFSSGKGLGGHKRVHTQASKRHHQFLAKKIHKAKFKKSRDDLHDSKSKKDDSDATCVMCGKTFPSMKSLFGHMRSHPDREWRGIHPPGSNHSMPVAILESARGAVRDRASVDPDDIYQISSPADNALLQSTLDLPSGSPSGLDWASTEVELEASDILLLLAKGNHAFSNSSSTSGPEGKLARGDNYNAEEVIKGEYDDKIRLMVSKKQKMESSPPDKKVKRESSQADRAYTTTVRDGKGKGKMDEFQGCDEDDKGYSHGAESNCEDVEYKVTKYQLELSILVEKEVEKKKRKQSSRNSVSRKISKTSQRFKCNICNKSFSTHQALGSHMSSHSKVTIKKSQSGDDHEIDNEGSPADQEADESALIAAATQEADGGADAECGGESGDGALQASGCKRFVIDLNELPPIEEDEQEG
ncbi:hypothetical protein NL676_025460 [Syzygium grande]|nr:hypothetical protein NL676_025460 [Syzygium grande]